MKRAMKVIATLGLSVATLGVTQSAAFAHSYVVYWADYPTLEECISVGEFWEGRVESRHGGYVETYDCNQDIDGSSVLILYTR